MKLLEGVTASGHESIDLVSGNMLKHYATVQASDHYWQSWITSISKEDRRAQVIANETDTLSKDLRSFEDARPTGSSKSKQRYHPEAESLSNEQLFGEAIRDQSAEAFKAELRSRESYQQSSAKKPDARGRDHRREINVTRTTSSNFRSSSRAQPRSEFVTAQARHSNSSKEEEDRPQHPFNSTPRNGSESSNSDETSDDPQSPSYESSGHDSARKSRPVDASESFIKLLGILGDKYLHPNDFPRGPPREKFNEKRREVEGEGSEEGFGEIKAVGREGPRERLKERRRREGSGEGSSIPRDTRYSRYRERK